MADPKNPEAPKKKPDRSEDVFMREVDDAVRQDDMENFFRRYGLIIAGVVVLGLAGLAGWIFWQNEQAEEAGLRSEEYVAALDSVQQNNLDGATTALAKLGDADQAGYSAASQLMLANIDLQKGEADKAVALYKKISADEDVPEAYRQLAIVREVATQFDDLKPEAIIARLQPIAVAGNPWFGSAGEMTALAHMRKGDEKAAGRVYGEIAKDKQVPQTIRSRAVQMAGMLGVDAVVIDEKSTIPTDPEESLDEAEESSQ